MNRKIIPIILISLFCLPVSSYADAHMLAEFQSGNVEITLIYSSKEGNRSPNVKKLDLLLHHFTNEVHMIPADEVTKSDVQSTTHIVYYGEDELPIIQETIQVIDQFNGPVIGIGENVIQFASFSELEQDGTVHIKEMTRQGSKTDLISLHHAVPIQQIKETENMNVLLYGHRGKTQYPLFIQHKNRYYYGVVNVEEQIKYLLGDILHDIIPHNHPNEHLAYIRLEDIHPMSDPEKLLAIGEVLNERDIPFILVVIPVYITPETGERVHFSSSPELVSVLQHLQDTGGTVISHGYTHQYRDSETGEGFEFWDVENEQFIIESDPTNEIEIIKDQDAFPNEEAYANYLQPFQEQEKKYIEDRLEKSVHELLTYDLYPVAFEAPHYTMSQQGYGITSNYFSTIFGQLQYTDDRWEIMGSPPYVTTATYLNDMVLFPETIGYVDPSINHPFMENEKRLEQTLLVRDSMIGGFYHPYLGVEYLEEFLSIFDQIPNVKWVNLKMDNHWVKTPKVSIVTDGSGDIHVTNDLSWWDRWKRQNEYSLFENVLWLVTIVVLIFICLFILFTLHLRTQLKKQLFMERDRIG